MAVLSVLYNVPRFFEFKWNCVDRARVERISKIVNGQDVGDVSTSDLLASRSCVYADCETELKKSDLYGIVYENVLYCLVVYFIPLVLLAIFNSSAVVRLCRSRRQFRSPNARLLSEKDFNDLDNITRVMLVIIVVFIVTQTPAYVNQLLYYLLAEEAYQCGRAYFYYYHVSNLVVSSNSCLNFIVYCVCRRSFRLACVRDLCYNWRCLRTRSTATSTRNSSLQPETSYI